MVIYKAAVIGGGKMGAEIAQVITYSGLPVKIKEASPELAEQALLKIRAIYESRVKKGKMTESEMEGKMSLVVPISDYRELEDVDIVIEAVPEKMALKREVFAACDAACPEHAILASNTSALSISALGAGTGRPDKVIGMHFFYPAHLMKLVEVIPGLATSQEVIDATLLFAESLRKIAVRVNECAGFLVNRLLMPYLNEAAFCLQEGAGGAREIDDQMVKFGFPMGPFTLVDNLGLDICVEVVGTLLDAYGDRMAPAEIWKEILKRGRLGIKTGAGFYNYKDPSDRTLEDIIRSAKAARRAGGLAFSSERLLYPMINEAAYCIQENISNANDIDVALLAGIGFPQDRGGLLRYADSIGLDRVLAELKDLEKACGSRFFPAPLLKRMVGAGFLGEKTKHGFLEYP